MKEQEEAYASGNEEIMSLPMEAIVIALGKRDLEILMLREVLAQREGPTPTGSIIPADHIGFAIPIKPPSAEAR